MSTYNNPNISNHIVNKIHEHLLPPPDTLPSVVGKEKVAEYVFIVF